MSKLQPRKDSYRHGNQRFRVSAIVCALVLLSVQASLGSRLATSEVKISSQTQQPQTAFANPIRGFAVPTNDSGPLAIISGSNGTMWFSEFHAGKIAEFSTLNNSFHEFQIPENGSRPAGLSFDSHGKIWFADESGSGSIWSFDPSTDNFMQYKTTSQNSTPIFVLVCARGDVWFTESTTNKIGELSYPSYAMSEFSLPISNSGPVEIAFAQNDSTLWITQSFAGKIASFNILSHTFKEYSPPSNEGLKSPVGIIVDNQGNVWISDHGGSSVDELNPANSTFRKFPTSVPVTYSNYSISAVATLAIDSKGRLWFVEHFSNKVGVLNPTTGTIQEFNIPTPGAYSVLNALDANGNFWFTEYYANEIGEISGNTTTSISTTPETTGAITDAAGHTIDEMILVKNELNRSVVVQLSDSSSFTQTGQTPVGEVSINETTINLPARGSETIEASLTPDASLGSGLFSVGIVATLGNESSISILFVEVQGQFSVTQWVVSNYQILIAVVIVGLVSVFFMSRRQPRSKQT